MQPGGRRATDDGWLARHGREVVAVVGLAVLVASLLAGFLTDDVAFPTIAFCAGAVMLTISSLLPSIGRIKAGPTGIEIDTRQVDQVEVTAGLAASGQEPNAEVDAADVDDIVGSFRWLAASDAIGRWLRTPPDPLEDCHLHLFLYDGDAGQLVPAFEEDPDRPAESWSPGRGAVGIAWQERELVVVEGSACFDETFGLTPEQQQRYQALAYVVAVPVLNAGGDAIAVLSASTQDLGSPLGAEEGQLALVALAEYIARVLVDVLKWFTDSTEGEGT